MLSAAAAPVGVAGLQRGVVDLQRSIDFYCGALGFRSVSNGTDNNATMRTGRAAPRARLALGAEHIDLVQVAAADLPAPAFAPDPRFQHAAIVAADMDAAWQRLRSFAPVAISDGGVPQQLPASAGGVVAFKFRDPDGHPLELIQFPPGAGDPRWQAEPGGAPTLGIDHVALVVADVERSIAFFAAHGFHVAARRLNRGVEQDRLDGLRDVVVDVVALRCAESTPHLELLGYRLPRAAAGTLGDVAPGAPGRDVIRLQADGSGAEGRTFTDPDGHAFVMRSG